MNGVVFQVSVMTMAIRAGHFSDHWMLVPRILLSDAARVVDDLPQLGA